ncbi:MAG: ArdC-like ssDNA-binding domain-containing protein [Acidimicrobiia bacterium]|nr:ArdC-like ssDNA-binding domain-containing protein [Acidimicrobiia bacterium]
METAERKTSGDDAVDRLHQQLQDSLQELVTSEDWQRALSVAARFHDYSFANTRLIWAQSIARGSTLSRVAGYRAWQKLGRHVRKGERGLQILAPVIRKVTPDNGEEEERRVVGFRVVHVFDIAQTDGDPLPEVPITLVEGDLPSHWEQVRGLITESGFDLQVADIERLGEANGITDWKRRDVVVRASLPGAQRFKTAVHELAHIRLHEPNSDGRPSCRGIVEVEAESVAYMVCAGLGIDSAGYSLGYVASWSGGDLTKVAATANRVIGCARQVLAQIEQERQLGREAVSSGSRMEVRDRESPQRTPAPTARSDLEAAVNAATAFYQRQLHEPAGAAAVECLGGRGIDTEAIDLWQLGYAPDSWQALTTALRKQGFSDDLLLGAGVAGRSRYARVYDRMRNRVIFPIHDEHGEPRGFAGRLLTGDGPKYLNTPETDLYQKRSLLYGFHLARQPIVETGNAVVVEGYTDAIAAHQAGITNVVATAGTALTPEHLETLSRITANVTLLFDGDQAGVLAVERAGVLDQAKNSIRVSVAHLPPGLDPAELLARDTQALMQVLTTAVPIEHHLIDQIIANHNLEEPEAMARAIHAATEVIRSVGYADIRHAATAHLATRIGRDEQLIHTYLEQSLQRQPHKRGRARTLGIA